MTIAVDIHPSSSTLYMINEPDSSTAYSLSGHVSVSLSSNNSFFEKGRAEKVLLRSLTLTFEGQAELITNETGYSSVRLCKLRRELVPAQTILLSNDGQEDSVWNFVFDLPVPGWLPSSSIYGCDAQGPAGTSYALYAEAQFTPLLEGVHLRSWSLSALCSSFMPKTKTVLAERAEIEIVRCATPTIFDESSLTPCFGEAVYLVDTGTKLMKESESQVTADIFSKIEVRASVPECIDVDSSKFVLTLRLRAGALPVEQQQRLRLLQFRMMLSQQEIYSRTPSRSYTSMFSLPTSQPDTEPLLCTHPMKALYDIGLSSVMPNVLVKGIRASFPLLSRKQLGRYSLPSGGIPLHHACVETAEDVWVRMDVCVPFEHVSVGEDEDWELQHGRVKALRPDEDSPLFRVRHDLEVELTFTYEAEEAGSDQSVERMVFKVPIRFARLPPSQTHDGDESVRPQARDDRPIILPAYSQLFYPNGERKIDESHPLPAYTPHADEDKALSELVARKL